MAYESVGASTTVMALVLAGILVACSSETAETPDPTDPARATETDEGTETGGATEADETDELADASAETTTEPDFLSPDECEGGKYPGYYCLAYEKAGTDAARLEISNYSENCMGPVGGTIDVAAADQITLRISRQSDCNYAAGCFCEWDMSLEVQGIATDRDVTVTLEHLSCEGTPTGCRDVAVLPLGGADSGIACRHAHSVETGVGPGAEGYLCGPDLGASGTPRCAEGLECAVVGEPPEATEERCLAACAQTADCPEPTLQTCQDGLCRVTHYLGSECD